MGIGKVLLLPDAMDLMTVLDADADRESVEIELGKFRDAVLATLQDFAESQRAMASSVSSDVAEIFTVYQMLLQGEEFSGEVESVIASGKAAAPALRTVVSKLMDRFEAMDDEYLRARSEDIRNLGNRVYARLRNFVPPKIKANEKVALVGSLVSITDVAEYPVSQLAGIVSMDGSAISTR